MERLQEIKIRVAEKCKNLKQKSYYKRKRAADKDATTMSFSILCPRCANQTPYSKYTSRTIRQQLLLLLAPFTKAKISIPIYPKPKRKAQ